MRLILVSLIMGAIAMPTGAIAQTAEETVAFLLWGVEDGRFYQSEEGKTAVVLQTGRSDVSFDVDIYNDEETAREAYWAAIHPDGPLSSVGPAPEPELSVRLEVERNDDCHYSARIEGDEVDGFFPYAFDLDFTKFSHVATLYELTDTLALQFRGRCPISQHDGKFCDRYIPIPTVTGSEHRLRMNLAATYFKETFCSGYAF